MSRVAKKPIAVAKGVEFNIQSDKVGVKGPKGTLSIAKPEGVVVKVEDGVATLSTTDVALVPLTGTLRAILANRSRACPKASSASSSWSASATARRCRART